MRWPSDEGPADDRPDMTSKTDCPFRMPVELGNDRISSGRIRQQGHFDFGV
jgi:hypothetical protein